MASIFENVGRAMANRTVAHADDFKVELEDDWVHIKDGENSTRLSMPLDVWDKLVRSYSK